MDIGQQTDRTREKHTRPHKASVSEDLQAIYLLPNVQTWCLAIAD